MYSHQKQFIVAVLLALGLVGCRETPPNLRVDVKSGDTVTPVEEAQSTGTEVKVVTGENATIEEDRKEEGMTGEDKTGAVAVKMEY